jgi:hypothetical protein
MNYIVKILALVCALCLAACASTVKTLPVASSQVIFSASDSFFVACSNNGMYNSREYPYSAAEVSNAVYNILLRHSDYVQKSDTIASRENALKDAKSKNLKYLVGIQILQWEDRVSSWLGVPDKVEIKLSIIDCADGKIVHSAVIEGEGPKYAFGNDYPQDMLGDAAGKYFEALFKKGK